MLKSHCGISNGKRCCEASGVLTLGYLAEVLSSRLATMAILVVTGSFSLCGGTGRIWIHNNN